MWRRLTSTGLNVPKRGARKCGTAMQKRLGWRWKILANICTTTVHDPDYRTSWNDWSTFVESLTEKIAEKDETIPELPPKDLVFRIYRDIRFSSDPTPYKVRVTRGCFCVTTTAISVV